MKSILCQTMLVVAFITSGGGLAYAEAGDPPEAEIQAVLGPDTKVERTGPGAYVVDGDTTDLKKLLGRTLPEREKTLKTIEENIDQRLAAGDAASNGVSLDAKRAQCQGLAVNSIPRTRCYQELEMLRDQGNETTTAVADQRQDDELQKDKLQREVDAIDQFEKRYGGGTPSGTPATAPTTVIVPASPSDTPNLFGAPRH